MLAKDLISKDFIKADINNTLSRLIGKFKQTNQTHAVIFDKKKYLGVISKKFFLTSRLNVDVAKVSNVLKKRSKSKVNIFVPELSLKDDIEKITKLMYTADVKILPVFDKGKFLGVVQLRDILKSISTKYKGISVAAISSIPITISIDEPVGFVIKLFNRCKFHRVPVVDKRDNLVGMITLSDLIKNYHIWSRTKGWMIPSNAQHQGFKMSGTGEKTSQINASISAMISYAPLYTVKKDASIAQAINVMVKADISSVVIVDQKKVIGILTARDVLKDYAKT